MSRTAVTGPGRAGKTGDPLPSAPLPRRLRREQRTVRIMVSMYCHRHHLPAAPGATRLCAQCAALLDYADSRVTACRFGERKPVCSACSVHCFRPVQRERMRAVMRYAGPRMALHHPYLAFRHLLDRGSV